MSEARYACPCCGYLTLTEKPPGTFAICPVCFWEDDEVQFKDQRPRAVQTRSVSSKRARTSASSEQLCSSLWGRYGHLRLRKEAECTAHASRSSWERAQKGPPAAPGADAPLRLAAR